MASKKKVRRQQVPYMTDAEPSQQQVEDYYLQRKQGDTYDAPLEWQGSGPVDRGHRPALSDDEPPPEFDRQAERTAANELLKNSTRGSKPFKGKELRCGYRKL